MFTAFIRRARATPLAPLSPLTPLTPLTPLRPPRAPQLLALLALALPLHTLPAQAADTSPAEQLARFATLAGAPGQAERGRVFFTSRHGGEWSCASCHGQPPVATGKHASTGKAIEPLAPVANAKVFTDTARVDKWLRRNCNDVLKRECTSGEKADVLAYLVSLKP
ncbi:MAG: DUF1924 domain-containing protein [Rubrivivax sp.]|nr:DUF1924 domain-containing protein [Rubrivivax sp.]